MEPRYQCSFQASEEICLECLKWETYRSPHSIVLQILTWVAIGIIALGYLLIGVVAALNHVPFRVSEDMIFVTVILVVYALCFFLLRYKFSVRNTKRRLEELYHGEFPVIRLSFTEECMVSEAGGETTRLYYSDVKRMYRWKNYLYLRTKSRLIHFLPAEGMENGTLEDLTAYLREKGVR